MNIKPDDKLAMCVYSNAGNDGRLFDIVCYIGPQLVRGEMVPCWAVRALDGKPVKWIFGYVGEYLADSRLRPIRDQPGNEQFVTELRNKLPRSKPATTKQDTIDARGMVRS